MYKYIYMYVKIYYYISNKYSKYFYKTRMG